MSWWQHIRQTVSPHAPAYPESGPLDRPRFRWIRGRRYVEGTAYTGPKDADADQFLDFQHHIVRRVLGGNHWAPLSEPREILDVGCGTGRWVIEMATEFPAAQVIGFDLVRPENVEPVLAALGQGAANVVFAEGDVLKGLPYADGVFDLVHLRLLYSDLPAMSWPGVIRELARVTKPGGWVEVVDTTEVIHDPSPAYALMASWISELCRRRGLDPDLGPKLKHLFAASGLENVSERIMPSFPDLTQTRERRLWQTQAIGVMEVMFHDPFIEAGIASEMDYQNALEGMRIELEQGQHANSDLIYDVIGQRLW